MTLLPLVLSKPSKPVFSRRLYLPGLLSSARSAVASWRIDYILMIVAIFSSSFDIFANVMIGEYNVRFCQLALLPIALFAFIELFRRPISSWPQGYAWLLMWCAVQLILCLRPPSLLNALGYEVWLVFDALTIAGFTFFISSERDFKFIMKAYLYSFAVMAVVGLAQLILYAVGIKFFVAQTWGPRWARINGFSFEPSYYSTYMLMGFVIHAYLLEKKNEVILARRSLVVNFALITVAMVLSTSRMGILMMIAWVALRYFLALARGAIGKKKSSRVLLFLGMCAVLIVVVLALVLSDRGLISYYLQGLGIAGTSSHSADGRFNGLAACIEVFLESPLLGYGLGGVDPAIAQHLGSAYVAGDNGASMSIIGDMLVANGIVGLIPVVAYLGSLLFFRKAHIAKACSQEMVGLHKALIWALVFELVILCFNQNILRAYFWLHIAIMAASWWCICRRPQNRGIVLSREFNSKE